MQFLQVLRSSALSVALLISCGGDNQEPPAYEGEQLRVLFVGNSLTFDNDLPALTQAIAASTDATPMVIGRVIRGGFSLDDHWEQGVAQGMIKQKVWDVVVLQQGPSGLPESQVALLASTKKFAALAKEHDARVALLMVWPDASRPAAFDSVRMSYGNAAEAVGGIFVPAGEAWRAAWRRDPTLELYGGDGFHPAPMGSYLAALTLFQQLYGRSPIGVTATIIDPAKVALLQEAAAEADAEYGRR